MPNHAHGIIGIVDQTPGSDNATPTPAATPTVGADPRVRPVSAPHPPSPSDPRVRDASVPCERPRAIPDQGTHTGAPLPQIMQWWKTMTTNAYIRGVRGQGWPPFDRRLWQRNYYERIVRTPRELDLTHRYIRDNPLRWSLDRLRPPHSERGPSR